MFFQRKKGDFIYDCSFKWFPGKFHGKKKKVSTCCAHQILLFREGGGQDPLQARELLKEAMGPCDLSVLSFSNAGSLFLIPTLMTEANPWHFPTVQSS